MTGAMDDLLELALPYLKLFAVLAVLSVLARLFSPAADLRVSLALCLMVTILCAVVNEGK